MANWETEFVKMIKEICKEEEIGIISFDDWAFCLKKDEHCGFIYGYQFGLDNAASAAILKDKAAASEMMTAAGIQHIPHWCVMNPANPEFCSLESGWKFMTELLDRYGELVVKDNLGTGGRLVFHVRNSMQLEQASQVIFEKASSLAVSPYTKILEEYRVIVLDGQVEIVFCKDRPHVTGDGHSTLKQLLCDKIMDSNDSQLRSMFMHEQQPDFLAGVLNGDAVPENNKQVVLEWKHNLGQGASASIITDQNIIDELLPVVSQAARLFDLHFASVDVVRTAEGIKILEINSGVMMENLAKTDRNCRNLAKETYRKAIRKMLNI